MTQDEVYKFLRKKKKWMSTKEIAKELNKSDGSISKNLMRLYHHGDILTKKSGVYQEGSLWKTKED